MKSLKLVRFLEGPGIGTFGILHGQGFACFTVERPWRNNEVNISCIPVGDYMCERDKMGRHQVYRILDVPGRTAIEFHAANKASELQGCIGLGESHGAVDGMIQVQESGSAIYRLIAYCGDGRFALKIRSNTNEKL